MSDNTNTNTDDTATVDTSADQQQQTDQQNASDQPTQDTTQDTTQQPAPGAPESYEAFTVPDGMSLDESIMGEFSQLAKDANLTQEKAQGLVELGVKMAKGFESATQQSLDDLKAQFATDLANDNDLGGEQLDANLAIAQRAINAYGSKELKTMLSESGLGKHPELVRFFHAVGQTVSEDNDVDSGAPQGGEKSLAEKLYGTSNAA